MQRTILFLLLGGYLECDLRAMGVSSLQLQRGAELPAAVLDAVQEEYALASFMSADELRDAVKAERRTSLRAFVSNPSLANFIAYTHPSAFAPGDVAFFNSLKLVPE